MTFIEARTDLSSSPTAPLAARRFIRSALAQWGYDSLLESVTLLTNELVTNAVLHAGSDISLSVCARDGLLRVEVSDGSPGPLARRFYKGDAQTGRGLALVEKVATTWGVQEYRGGKTVWFEVST